MSSLAILGSIAGIHILAIASPGPTLAAVLSYALNGDRRAGFLLAGGVVLATIFWATATMMGLNRLLTDMPQLYRAMQLLGATYLMYLGAKIIFGKFRARTASHVTARAKPVTGWRAVQTGFLTNVTNPKVVAYYASLFGVLIPPTAPGWLFWAATLTVTAISAVWWVSATLLLTYSPVHNAYERARPVMDSLMAAALIGLGIKLVIA